MIISLHTPKAGGSSFKQILIEQFGDGFKRDYKDLPLHHTRDERIQTARTYSRRMHWYRRYKFRRRGIECVHGHFMPYKYHRFRRDRNVVFVTWLRDPVERLLSHYHFWLRSINENSGPLHKRMVEEQWTLEQFCLSEEMRNVYSKFLWKFPVSNFDFIGITESFDEDLRYFVDTYFNGQVLDEIPRTNVNPTATGKYADGHPKEFIEKVREWNAEDYSIYESALHMRDQRVGR